MAQQRQQCRSREAEPGTAWPASPGLTARGIFLSMMAPIAVHRTQAATTVIAASRTGRANSCARLPGAGSTRSTPQVSASQTPPRMQRSASETRCNARRSLSRRKVSCTSVASTRNRRAITLWPTCPSTVSTTTIPVVALAALNTEEVVCPRRISNAATRYMPIARAIKNQCHEAATARRIGPGSCPVAARSA